MGKDFGTFCPRQCLLSRYVLVSEQVPPCQEEGIVMSSAAVDGQSPSTLGLLCLHPVHDIQTQDKTLGSSRSEPPHAGSAFPASSVDNVDKT